MFHQIPVIDAVVTVPRAKKNPDKWTSPRTKGTVHNRNGFAVMRFNGQKKTTGLKFHPDNERSCLMMLEKWVKSIQHPDLATVSAPVRQSKIPTLYEAIERFEEVRYPALTHWTKKNYDRTFSYFARRDVPLNYTNVYQLIVERNSAAVNPDSGEQLAHNTRHKYLQYLKAFFDYVVEQEWLKKNPVEAIGLPRREAKKDILVYSRDEIQAIADEIRKRAGHEDYALLVELLGLTGLRISEALGLRWVDITERGVKVMNAKGGKPRNVPTRLIPGCPELLDRLRTLMEEYKTSPPGQRRRHSKPDFVFWWIDPTDPRLVFNEAKAQLELANDGRTLHTLRGSAEWWWENVLGWDERTICDVAGHTSQVRHSHYRTVPTIEELEARGMSAKSPAVGTENV